MTPELRFGPWWEVLADIAECDSLISDPPFSERTAKGFRSGNNEDWAVGEEIEYGFITEQDVADFVDSWDGKVKKWWVIFGDHISIRWWETHFERIGLYVFPPIPWIKSNAPPRFASDGPAPATEWIIVARPKKRLAKADMGSRPGYYKVGRTLDRVLVGAKNRDGMRALIRDYSLPGDLIVDPFSGSGSTLIAAAIEGRRSIGSERSEKTYKKAAKILAKGYTPTMFAE